MFKRIFKKSIFVLLGIVFMQLPVFGSSPIHIEIDGVRQVIPLDKGTPYIYKDTTMVPLAFVSDELGHKVGWIESTKTVTIDNDKIKLTINDKNAFSNNKNIKLDIAPLIKNGRTYVPLRFVATELGSEVSYQNRTVMIGKSGSVATNSKNSSLDIKQIIKKQGYELEEYKTADVTKDGIKDYIAIGKKAWDAYLFVIDGATGKTVATEKVFPGEYGCSLTIDLVGGNYHILYTAHDSIPIQKLYEFKDGSLKNHSKTLNEEFKIKPSKNTSMMVIYNNSAYNQEFQMSSYKYNDLMIDADWYPITIAKIKNGMLEVGRDIIFPYIGNLEQFKMLEEYKWNGSKWELFKVSYEDYNQDFYKVSIMKEKNIESYKSALIKNKKVVIDESNINTLFGLSLSQAKEIFGSYTQEWVGMLFENYSMAMFFEINNPNSLSSSVTLFQGAEFMGLNITETPVQVASKLGAPISEGISEMDGDYVMLYNLMGHETYISFPNKKGKIKYILVKK